MKRQSITILALVAVLAIVAMSWLVGARQARDDVAANDLLIPHLSAAINDISRLAISGREEERVTLEKGADGWHVVERGGYPANIQDLRRHLIALADAKLIEKKTANPAHHPRIELAPPDAGEGAGIRVVLEGLAEPVQWIFGKTNFRGNPSTYARRDGDDQSWLASGDLRLPTMPEDWLAKEVLDVPTKRVRRVSIVHPDGSQLTIEKDDPEVPNFTVLGVPEGRELQAPSAGNAVASALGDLRLSDVRAAGEDQVDAPAVAVFETFDGLRVRARAWREEDLTYVSLAAEFDANAIVVVPQVEDEETPVDQEPPDSASSAAAANNENLSAKVAAEAAEIQARVANWIYEIPSYKYDNLTKKMDALLKPLPEETASEDS